MKKAIAFLGSFLIFAGVKAQTTPIKKETAKEPTVVSKPNASTISKTDKPGSKAIKAEGKFIKAESKDIKVESKAIKVESKVSDKLDSKAIKVESKKL